MKSWKKFLTEEINTIYGHQQEDLIDNLKNAEGIREEEAEEMIDIQMDHLKSFEESPVVELYRIVFAKTIDDVRRDKMGHHFTDDMESFHLHMMEYLLGNAQKEDASYKLEDARIIKVSVPPSAIDFEETMRTWSLFPYEYEITVRDVNKIKIVDVFNAYEG